MRIVLKAVLACVPVLMLAGAPAFAAPKKAAHHSCSASTHSCGAKAKKHRSAKAHARTKRAHKASAGGGYSGMASWYGGKFHGRKTASGERYNQGAMTAAHKTLPFGTRVRVTHARTGNSVVVRINDRGPFIRGRIIDLSRAAASQIGLTATGVAPVRVTVLGRG